MAQSKEFPQYKWVSARSYTKGRKSGQPTVIVMHTTEGSEGLQSAENGAAYDARRTDGTSTHFFVDQDSIIQSVLISDEAHAARSRGNDIGIQIEVCGRAAQDLSQWSDAASAGSIEHAAQVCVVIRKKYGAARFPLVRLTPSQLRAGKHGFCGHIDITNAFPEDNGTHTDPGPNFPWSKLFARIKQIEEENDMPSLPEIAQAVASKINTDLQNTKSGIYLNLCKILDERIMAALTKVIPFEAGPGTRIHAAGWADMSIVRRLDYLCELVMSKPNPDGTGGSVSDRLTRLEETAKSGPAIAEDVEAIRVQVAELVAASQK